jgi:predicted TIM-barrel fold metal-dependent hydrolase
MTRIIDFHAHLDERWLHMKCHTATDVVRLLDRFDVEAACVFTIMGFYEECRGHNDALLRRANEYPNRLIPFVTVDPKQGRDAVDELERCLSNRRFRGVKFHPWLQAFASSMLRDTMMDILHVAAKYKVPVLLHDGTPPYSTTFQVAELARWSPDTIVVLGHAGLADYVDPAAQLIRDIPNLYGCFCGPRAGDLIHLVELAGADKITFGSDFGAAGWRLLPERIDNVLQSGLSEPILDRILYSNSAELLRLDEFPLSDASNLVAGAHP